MKIKQGVKERAFNRLLSQYKSGAKKRGHDFNLTLGDIRELTQQQCTFCGRWDSNTINVGGIGVPYMGIDRKDSKIGYERSNCIPCCKQCNSLKGAVGWVRWADFINRIAEHHGGVRPFPEVPEVEGLISLWRGR